jgi:hypothetical protein
MIVGAFSQGPMEFAVSCRDREFVDARMSRIHQPLIVEFPILVPVSAEAVPGIIVVFVCESNGNPALGDAEFRRHLVGVHQPVISGHRVRLSQGCRFDRAQGAFRRRNISFEVRLIGGIN